MLAPSSLPSLAERRTTARCVEPAGIERDGGVERERASGVNLEKSDPTNEDVHGHHSKRKEDHPLYLRGSSLMTGTSSQLAIPDAKIPQLENKIVIYTTTTTTTWYCIIHGRTPAH